MAVLPFPIETDVEHEFDLTLPDGSAFTGQSNIACAISDTDGGPAVTGMAPVTAIESSTVPGRYSVTFDAVDSIAYLTTARVGAFGYLVTTQGSKVLASDPVRFITAPRATS